jgi:hypothetical protein
MDSDKSMGPMELVRVEATVSDSEWVEVIGLAMKADLEASVRRRVIEELLTIRQMSKMMVARPLKTA